MWFRKVRWTLYEVAELLLAVALFVVFLSHLWDFLSPVLNKIAPVIISIFA
jgi:hypothetical protein